MIDIPGSRQALQQPSWPMLVDLSDDECRRTLRRLELQAYSTIISVFRAQGPFTETKQSVLKELKKLLSISVDRHKAEIRRAVNDEELATISDWIWGSSVDDKWITEGRRVVNIRGRPTPETIFSDRANQIARRHQLANEKFVSPGQTGNLEAANAPAKVTGRKQTHSRLVSSPSTVMGPDAFQSQMNASQGSSGTVVLTESPSGCANVSQMEYSMMIAESIDISNPEVGTSDSGGVVIETLAAEVPHAELIIDSYDPQIKSPQFNTSATSHRHHQQPASTHTGNAGEEVSQRFVLASSAPGGGLLHQHPTYATGGHHAGRQVVVVNRSSAQEMVHSNRGPIPMNRDSGSTPVIANVQSLQAVMGKMGGHQQLAARLPGHARIVPVESGPMDHRGPRKPGGPANVIVVQRGGHIPPGKAGQSTARLEAASSSQGGSSGGRYRILGVPTVSGGSSQQHYYSSKSTPTFVQSGGTTSQAGSGPSRVASLLSAVHARSTKLGVDLDAEEEEASEQVLRPRINPHSEERMRSRPAGMDGPPVINISDTGEITVSEKRSRPGDGAPSWPQLALGLLNRFITSWSDQAGPAVAIYLDRFNEIKDRLLCGKYSRIDDFNSDIHRIQKHGLENTRGDDALRRDTEEVFTVYRQEYTTLVNKLYKGEGLQSSKRPRFSPHTL